LTPLIEELRASGCHTAAAIAAALNARGVPSPAGKAAPRNYGVICGGLGLMV
jgi:hypothetical protein